MPTSFSDLGVPARLVTALAGTGVTDPFPIQVATLPDGLAGRDVLGRGRTGSGKTLAFALPLVVRLAGRLAGGPRRAGRPLGLVLAPTRELATQIAVAIEPLATASGLTVTTVFGGVSQQRQVQALKAGADIVVACPGRLEDLLSQRVLTLDAIEITVLDEADHMADLGFLPGVTRILTKTPAGGQRMLFSATLDNGVDKLVHRFLSKPVTHSVDDGTPAVDSMSHAVLEVADAEGKRKLIEALASGTERRILFVRTKHVAKRLAKQLGDAGIAAVDLQGNLSQNARERNLAAFGSGEARVLVATDVAARGVHVDDVALVVHVDPPTEHKAYLHRSGRTARAGASGTVATIVLPEQRRDVAALLKRAGISAPAVSATPETAEVRTLIGVVAPRVARPVVQAAQQQSRRPAAGSQSARGRTGGRAGSAVGEGRGGVGRTAGSSGRGGRPAGATGATGRAAGASKSGGRPGGGSAAVWSSTTGGTSGGSYSEPRRTDRPRRARG